MSCRTQTPPSARVARLARGCRRRSAPQRCCCCRSRCRRRADHGRGAGAACGAAGASDCRRPPQDRPDARPFHPGCRPPEVAGDGVGARRPRAEHRVVARGSGGRVRRLIRTTPREGRRSTLDDDRRDPQRSRPESAPPPEAGIEARQLRVLGTGRAARRDVARHPLVHDRDREPGPGSMHEIGPADFSAPEASGVPQATQDGASGGTFRPSGSSRSRRSCSPVSGSRSRAARRWRRDLVAAGRTDLPPLPATSSAVAWLAVGLVLVSLCRTVGSLRAVLRRGEPKLAARRTADRWPIMRMAGHSDFETTERYVDARGDVLFERRACGCDSGTRYAATGTRNPVPQS